MKITKSEKTEQFHEVEVEHSFLFIKWRVKYRLINGTIWRFKSPNNYYTVGLCEFVDVRNIFDIPVQ